VPDLQEECKNSLGKNMSTAALKELFNQFDFLCIVAACCGDE
jgi:hypothetical protein